MTDEPRGIEPRDRRQVPEVLPDYFPTLEPIERLRVAKWNPRTIKSERFKNLMASMQADPDFMQLRPILAMADGIIYAGAHRRLAAEQLGWKQVWAVIGDVDEKTAKERALRDNHQWADWDDDLLEDMVTDLRNLGSNLDLLGFEQKELDSLTKGPDLPPPGDQQTDETPQMWGVIVTCSSEQEQVELMERLLEEGRQVRALMS